MKKKKILIIHGPNLNLLGIREKGVYGETTLDQVNYEIRRFAKEEGIDIDILQSNHEGELVEAIHKARDSFDAIVINPAAYTHTSIAIRDAIAAIDIPTIEVHISNIYKRESFRRHSFISEVAVGQVSGFGADSYLLGIKGSLYHLKRVNR